MNEYPGIQFEYAQIGGVRLHYAKAGDGGRLVILLHGFPECWYSWRHQISALSDEYTIVAPDLRGYNLSDKPPRVSDYRISNVVDDIIGLIHHLGHQKAAVFGHDWGGSVAWRMAMDHPEYLWKVGSLQTPPIAIWMKNLSIRQLAANWYMFFFQLPVIPEFILRLNDFKPLERALQGSTASPGVFSDDDIAVYKRTWSEPGSLRAMLNYYRANILARFSVRNQPVKGISVPSLFIFGEQDRAILHETVQGIGQMIDAPFTDIRIPQSGHWVQQEAKEEVTAVIRDFLAS
jgi:pimeloyl-ACP methyl ester carboxylesterase